MHTQLRFAILIDIHLWSYSFFNLMQTDCPEHSNSRLYVAGCHQEVQDEGNHAVCPEGQV